MGSSLRMEEASPAPMELKLAWEKELLGLYISGNPLEPFREKLEKHATPIKDILTDAKEGLDITIGGIIETIRPIRTKKGDEMAFVKISDFW